MHGPKDSFHFVKDKKIWGMIFDPGAAEGLVGTQTLKEYLEEVLWPRGLTYTKVHTTHPASFKGIEGKPQVSGLRCKLPVDLGPYVSSWEADTIGGHGDCCPMLFSNKSCVRQRLVVFWSYFQNGDGLCIFKTWQFENRMNCCMSGLN